MKKKILIVDDDHGIIRLLTIRLQYIGYEIIVAYDGVDCVKIAEEEKPNIILLDIKMPYRDGIDAFKKLIESEKTASIPVIFMSAYPRVEIKEQVLKMGANGFITKPFNEKEMENTITKVFDTYN